MSSAVMPCCFEHRYSQLLEEGLVDDRTVLIDRDRLTFLEKENRSRGEIAKIEQRFKVPVVLIPNISLETPHYHIERLRLDDERLDDDLASYKRAEDLSPIADDPYALKSAREKEEQQRPKQVPVIKNILPRDVAPTHTPREEQKPAAAAPANTEARE